MADPIKIIKNDHRTVEKLFSSYEALGDTAFETKKSIVEDIINELSMHTEMEETILYPKLKDKFPKEGDKMVEEAYAEHEIVKDLLVELETLDPKSEQYDAKVKVLNENVSHHVKEEEDELLPETEKAFSEEELEEIGEEMEKFKNAEI